MGIVVGGPPGWKIVAVPLPLGTRRPGAPPPTGLTIAVLPLWPATVPVRPVGPNTGVPGGGKFADPPPAAAQDDTASRNRTEGA